MVDPCMHLSDDQFVERARHFAQTAHAGMLYSGQDFVVHLDEVHSYLISVSHDRYARVGAYLHDVVEDTDQQLPIIVAEFGERVGEIVAFCTDAPGRSRKERKPPTYARVRESVDYLALLVKLCDRLGNVTKSSSYGPESMFKMYRSEHPSFKEAYYRDVLPNTLIQQRIDDILSR